MMEWNGWRHPVMVLKTYYIRGYGYIGLMVGGVLNILVFLKVYSDFLARFIPGDMLQYAFVVLIILINLGCIVLGLLDFRYGIWKIENNFGYKITPKSEEMYECTKMIPVLLEKIESLEKELKERDLVQKKV